MLKQKEIDLLRDAAIKLENTNLKMAYDLMSIAHKERPNGKYIEKKLYTYKSNLGITDVVEEKYRKQLQHLVNLGHIAIIPIGLRCYTKQMIFKTLGVKQTSLPFDSGFFSPHAVASVLMDPNIVMSFDGEGQDHAVCIKTEKNIDDRYGEGIKFQSSTYKYINNIVVNKNIDNINKYLDSTFGYYTLNIRHQFVLAHYNWHPFASNEKSKGIVNPEENLKIIEKIIQRRIIRMLDMIDKAKHVLFVFGNNQPYKYLQIDNEYYYLTDFERLKKVCFEKFGNKFSIIENIHEEKFSIKDALNCL